MHGGRLVIGTQLYACGSVQGERQHFRGGGVLKEICTFILVSYVQMQDPDRLVTRFWFLTHTIYTGELHTVRTDAYTQFIHVVYTCAMHTLLYVDQLTLEN